MNIGRPFINMFVVSRLIRSSRAFGPSVSCSLLSSRVPNFRVVSTTMPISVLKAGKRPPPPEFTILEDDDEDNGGDDPVTNYNPITQIETSRRSSDDGAMPFNPYDDASLPDFSIDFDNDGEVAVKAKAATRKRTSTASTTPNRYPSSRKSSPSTVSPNSSWMDRNDAFTNADGPKTFREDFRGTRVFVQNFPPQTSWQDLKDHFRIAGEVVFASVSGDPKTGESKGYGLVQFENTDMARNAIQIMSQHPLNGFTLSVRKDVQEGKAGATLSPSSSTGRTKGPTPPT
jgi:hypothetical protein